MPTEDVFGVLTAAPPAFSEATAAAILADRYALHGKLEALTSERDLNFLVTTAEGDQYVLKFANSAEDAAVTRLQTEALVHLARTAPELAVPRMVRTTRGELQTACAAADGRRHVVRVLTWLSGTPLQYSHRVAGYAGTLGTCLAQLGNALRSFEHAASGYALLWDLKRAAALQALLKYVEEPRLHAACARQLQRFEAHVRPGLGRIRWQVIHNDLNPSNVLVDPNNPQVVTGVIDFGDLVRSPLIMDVAVACAYLLRDTDDPLADVVEFVAAYSAVERLEAREIEVLFDLILTRATTTVLITHWRAARYPENRDYILRNEAGARRMLMRLSDAGTGEVPARLHAANGSQGEGSSE